MSSSVISVESLSKAYRIGQKLRKQDTLVGAVKDLVSAPLRNFQSLRTVRFSKQDSSILGGGEGTSHCGNRRLEQPGDEIFWALKDVSFGVREGDVVGVIGRNGAGKSTLLKILSRITEPTHGQAAIRGRVSSLLEVGTGFHPELTGRENVYMNGTILGMTKREIDRKFDEIVDFSGVETFLDTPAKRYSSGMQVRLAFAVAAHLDPEILFVDEVLAVGDIEFQTKCLGKMRDVARGGRTVLFVSHNVGAIESLCNRVVMLDQGEVAYDGDVAAGLHLYRIKNSHLAGRSGELQAGNGESTVFKSATLLDRTAAPTFAIAVGGPLHLRLSLDSPTRIPKPTFGLGIDDMFGQRILSIHSPATTPPMDELRGSTQLDVVVPVLPLAPGDYTIKLALSVNWREIDWVDDALRFTVNDGDVFGEGRTAHRGFCVASSQWSTL